MNVIPLKIFTSLVVPGALAHRLQRCTQMAARRPQNEVANKITNEIANSFDKAIENTKQRVDNNQGQNDWYFYEQVPS